SPKPLLKLLTSSASRAPAASQIYTLSLHERSSDLLGEIAFLVKHVGDAARHARGEVAAGLADHHHDAAGHVLAAVVADTLDHRRDRKSTRLNSSHVKISYAVFCLKKKNIATTRTPT